MKPRFRVLVSLLVFLCCGISGWSQRASPGTGTAPRLGQIRGQLRYADGRPGPVGAVVNLEPRGGGGVVMQTQTDRAGKFEFSQVPPALYEVHIQGPGFLPDYQAVDLTAFPSATVNFSLNVDSSHNGTAVVPPEGPGASIDASEANIPESTRKDVATAQQLIAKGKNLDKSIQLLNKAVTQYPQYGKAYLLMGVAYSSQKNWAEAEKSLLKAIEVDPTNAAAYVALGSVENEKKNYADAEKYLTKAVELSPESADAQFELGRAYWGLGRWDDAQAHVAKANQLRPNSAMQHLLMGNIMLRERNAEGALVEFKKSLELDPNGPMAEPTRQVIARIETALKQQAATSK